MLLNMCLALYKVIIYLGTKEKGDHVAVAEGKTTSTEKVIGEPVKDKG